MSICLNLKRPFRIITGQLRWHGTTIKIMLERYEAARSQIVFQEKGKG
jgi:hypothetical protein